MNDIWRLPKIVRLEASKVSVISAISGDKYPEIHISVYTDEDFVARGLSPVLIVGNIVLSNYKQYGFYAKESEIDSINEGDDVRLAWSVEHNSVKTEQVVKLPEIFDTSISPLIKALASFKGITAIESCEGDTYAYVSFRCGDWQSTGDFIDKLVSDLGYNFSIEWVGGCGTPPGYLRLPKENILPLTEILLAVAKKRVIIGV